MLARAALARFQLDDNRRFVRPHAAADAHTDRWRARMPRAPQGVIPLHNLSTPNVGESYLPFAISRYRCHRPNWYRCYESFNCQVTLTKHWHVTLRKAVAEEEEETFCSFWRLSSPDNCQLTDSPFADSLLACSGRQSLWIDCLQIATLPIRHNQQILQPHRREIAD